MAAVIEKYARATQSANLRNDAHHADADALAAVALSSDFGNLLFRVKYANDASSYPQLVAAWRYYVKLKAVVRKWPLNVKEARVADESLAWWLNDLCRPCNGKGRLELQPRVLSDEPCPHCEGSGKRPLQADRHHLKYVQDAVEMLEALTRQAGSRAMRKLAGEMELG